MNFIRFLLRDLYRYFFKYIPWVIIGILISFFFSNVNVHAQNITFDSCNYYTNTTSGTGTISGISLGNNTWYRCQSANALSGKEAVRYNFNGIQHNQSGYGIVSFLYTAPVDAQLVSASLQTSGNQYTCSVSTGYTYSDFADGNISYAIFCNNIPLYGNQNFIFRLNLNGSSNNNSFGLLNTSVNFYSEQQIANTIIQNQNSINNSINDVNDSLNNSDIDNDNVSNTLNGVNIGNQGVITQLITMPITLFTNILNSINGTCSSFSLGNLFGTNLFLPCINIENYIGSNLYTIIDIILSGFLAWGISRKIKKVFEEITNLREGDILDD